MSMDTHATVCEGVIYLSVMLRLIRISSVRALFFVSPLAGVAVGLPLVLGRDYRALPAGPAELDYIIGCDLFSPDYWFTRWYINPRMRL